MKRLTYRDRRKLVSMNRNELQSYQLQRLNSLLAEILPKNEFYAQKLSNHSAPLDSLDQLYEFPYTEKDELVGKDGFAANRTYELSHYSRFHRTSGTRGNPLAIVDTTKDWNWWIETWQFVLDVAHVTPDDRVGMAFSFGPFIGFWSANDAVIRRGAMVIPGGGMDTQARLELFEKSQTTVVCCTPTYALRMAEIATQLNYDLRSNSVTRIIVAGEPGGSVPSIRQRIETAWEATVIDHTGSTEVGPWGFGDVNGAGIHVVESEFIAEFRTLDSKDPPNREPSELILTSLGRVGAPLIRYRTGDLVRPCQHDANRDNHFVYLEGGVLGRADDMMIIRGVNIFPSSIEHILRGFPEVIEYRMTASKNGAMDSLKIEIEANDLDSADVAHELKIRLGLKVEVIPVQIGTLPRFEAKGNRFIDLR